MRHLKLPWLLYALSIGYIQGTFQRLPGSWFKVIILPINNLPISDCVSVLVEIVFMAVDDLPAGFIVRSLRSCVPPAILVLIPYIRQELPEPP
jgi:hypothetical protein